MPKNILLEFYYGNINPNEMQFKRDSDYGKTAKKLCAAEDKLKEHLDDECKKLLEELIKEQVNLSSMTAEEKFIYGFKTGARFALAIMDDESGDFKPIAD